MLELTEPQPLPSLESLMDDKDGTALASCNSLLGLMPTPATYCSVASLPLDTSSPPAHSRETTLGYVQPGKVYLP